MSTPSTPAPPWVTLPPGDEWKIIPGSMQIKTWRVLCRDRGQLIVGEAVAQESSACAAAQGLCCVHRVGLTNADMTKDFAGFVPLARTFGWP